RRRWARLERLLLDLGTFARVVTSFSDDEPATLTITVEEDDRYFGRYAVSYEHRKQAPGDQKSTLLENTTGEVDGEARNLFGYGARLGGRVRAGADVAETTGSAGVPPPAPAGGLPVPT